jgi:hypothetical protein
VLASGRVAHATESKGQGSKGQDWLQARDTALVEPDAWRYSVGLFNPAVLSLGRGYELSSHPLLFWIMPNATLRVAHLPLLPSSGSWGVTTEYGFWVPTLGMRLVQGTLFPSWERGGGEIGWSVSPSAAVVSSLRGNAPWRRDWVLTGRLDASVGVPLTHSDAGPLHAPEPLDLWLAPTLARYRTRVGVAWDTSLGRSLRASVYADLFIHGVERHWAWPRDWDNVTTRVGAGFDVGFGKSVRPRLTFGVAWWNSDQRAIDPDTWQLVRSNDVWPTLDLIWEG